MDKENNSFVEHQNATRLTWLIPISSITPGGSAVLGDNYIAFYAIHYTALVTIVVSLVSCFGVIIKIVSKLCNSNSKVGFTTRLPLYLAIADLLWGLSHFTDHLYLAIVQVYPTSDYVKLGLSINMGFFFGYQQIMQSCVAIYTYVGVVHGKKFSLGKFEWKLHLICVLLLLIPIAVFIPLNGFGNAGYWMGHDATTTNGKYLALVFTSSTTVCAICVTLSYAGVKRAVKNSKNDLRAFEISGSKKSLESCTKGNHTTATECLTTFVWVASCTYSPHALLLWICMAFSVFWDAEEPITCGLIVAVSNSSGWVNAYAYRRNERLKSNKNQERI